MKRKILIHACCGPCSTHVLSLFPEDEKTIYYSNSNIDTIEEFELRMKEAMRVADHFSSSFIADKYDHNEFLEAIAGFEQEAERGLRCYYCYKLRLEKTIKYALENGFERVYTTLTVSPYKSYLMIKQIANEIRSDDLFDPIDFKKRDGFLNSNKISKKLELYRQNYCGCEFSRKEKNDKN